MKKTHWSMVLLAVLAVWLPAKTWAAPNPVNTPTITVHADKVKTRVSPTLYGLMTEEINFSYEGGLYGELLRNRSFVGQRGVAYAADEPIYWTPLGGADISLDGKTPLNEALNVSLKLDAKGASDSHPVGVSNPGFWGIAVTPDTTYTVSFYAKAEGRGGPITVALAKASGAVVASASLASVSGEWKKYELKLTTGALAVSKDNVFTLTTTTPGKLWLQQVSLFGPTYKDRPNGNRRDLMAMMSALKPTFLRFPGGNYLEGETFAQRFDWKKTLGPPETRPGHRSPWNYWSTDGLGLMEFLLWCEELKMEPVLGVFAGYALNGEHVSSPEELAPHIQDALDEIEYVTGDVTTKWGAQRAKDGHPAPFALRYVEIGNEDVFDRSGSYDKRFSAFYKAIKAKHPRLQLISTMSAESTPSQRPDLVDEHTYAWGEGQMYEHVNDYDHRPREAPKVFVGEWATHSGWPMPNLKAAVADAAFLTGLERNSDVVLLSAYAPLLANISHVGGSSLDNSMQWATNLIGYDALKAFGTPSYYVQKMFAEAKGDVVLESTGAAIPKWTIDNKTFPSLYWVVTRNEKTRHIQIKLVNRGTTPQPVNLVLSGLKSVASRGTLTVLTADDPEAVNTIDDPARVTPKTVGFSGLSRDFTLTVPAYSVSVLDFAAR
ncbi:alpha-L-arabinofuranosidase C-terminal domain-containing protein [Caulobacter sp. UNC279MFTsu5.1]|uniref:alpha-L-arabinofuranosidase C-terminal domain-containing protein n=1 Tax=Caulobacter sp. UNC279MFTsu5.1 TaxID=1502775 RepID=UPI0003622E9C|nr:alpha-L-arabinofuranosidase C-terminal domain-containing protein [Caulobacter sp. UNC279MFTsu5.1]SFK56467.1 alpha-N-arabinofuranosidase [Caulobacter sp. UNC279MFTsu5.1]